MSDEVRLDRDQMQQIVQIFQAQSQAMSDMMRDVKGKFDPLAGGDWQGLGSEAFVSEMESEMFPTMQKLIELLNQSAQTTNQVNEILSHAEEEASNLFSNGWTI